MSLRKAINTWQNGQTPGEVDLFDAMIGYFGNQSFATVVGTDRTHQHHVDYEPLPPYYGAPNWGASVNKEISDVFFVVFSLRQGIVRMTHLQAKLRVKAWPKNHKTKKFTFKLDAGQFHMLHNRLLIKDSTHRFADDILAYPCFSDSVASYGVFYRDLQNRYDMAYEIASLISYPRRRLYNSPVSQLVHSFHTTRDIIGYRNSISHCHPCRRNGYFKSPELLSTTDVDVFEDGLIDLRVGTRVEFYEKILRDIANIFKLDRKIAPRFNALISELYPAKDERGHDLPSHGDRVNIEGGGVCVLLDSDIARERIER